MNMSKKWLAMSASDLGRGIENGEIDPGELAREFLAAINAHPHRDTIYSVVTADRAQSEAEAASKRARYGNRLGLLDGVPISWKDLFDSAGTATEAGSLLLKGRVPASDAEVLRNASMAGLVCLGKTHMSELAFSGLGLNPKTATSPNVNFEAAAPGGSSSGAAASVAFGLASCGIGSDTGGSVRVPAAWNDLVGLKTTAGLLSNSGVVPLVPKLDTIGPLARNVEDCARMLAVLENGKPVDLTGATLENAHFAVLETVVMDGIRDEPDMAYRNALELLEKAGVKLNPVKAEEAAEATELSYMLFTAEAYGTWGEVIESAPEKMFTPVLERFRSGRDCSSSEYVAGWLRLDELRRQWVKRMSPYDAVLMPSSPILPPEIDRLLSDRKYYLSENLLALRNTRISNLMGICSITLPTGIPSCGVMMCGLPFAEGRILRLAQAVEEILKIS